MFENPAKQNQSP